MWQAIVLLFIIQWTEITQRRVQSLTIIEYLNVIKQAATSLILAFVSDTVDALDLQRGKPTLNRRIVVTISFTTHAGDHSVNGERILEISTGILAAAIRMENETRRWLTRTYCHIESGQH